MQQKISGGSFDVCPTKWKILDSFVMTRTYKIQNYWFDHDPPKRRRAMNKSFRCLEKQLFKKFGELLRPTKERGYGYW